MQWPLSRHSARRLFHSQRSSEDAHRTGKLAVCAGSCFFAAAFVTLEGSFYPYVIPFTITIADAAAPESTLSFMFCGLG